MHCSTFDHLLPTRVNGRHYFDCALFTQILRFSLISLFFISMSKSNKACTAGHKSQRVQLLSWRILFAKNLCKQKKAAVNTFLTKWCDRPLCILSNLEKGDITVVKVDWLTPNICAVWSTRTHKYLKVPVRPTLHYIHIFRLQGVPKHTKLLLLCLALLRPNRLSITLLMGASNLSPLDEEIWIFPVSSGSLFSIDGVIFGG